MFHWWSGAIVETRESAGSRAGVRRGVPFQTKEHVRGVVAEATLGMSMVACGAAASYKAIYRGGVGRSRMDLQCLERIIKRFYDPGKLIDIVEAVESS